MVGLIGVPQCGQSPPYLHLQRPQSENYCKTTTFTHAGCRRWAVSGGREGAQLRLRRHPRPHERCQRGRRPGHEFLDLWCAASAAARRGRLGAECRDPIRGLRADQRGAGKSSQARAERPQIVVGQQVGPRNRGADRHLAASCGGKGPDVRPLLAATMLGVREFGSGLQPPEGHSRRPVFAPEYKKPEGKGQRRTRVNHQAVEVMSGAWDAHGGLYPGRWHVDDYEAGSLFPAPEGESGIWTAMVQKGVQGERYHPHRRVQFVYIF